MELEGSERRAFLSGAWRGIVVGLLWALLILMLFVAHAHADPAPASIYAALQAQRNTCQDQAALAAAGSGEELAKVKADLAALKKDFGVE